MGRRRLLGLRRRPRSQAGRAPSPRRLLRAPRAVSGSRTPRRRCRRPGVAVRGISAPQVGPAAERLGLVGRPGRGRLVRGERGVPPLGRPVGASASARGIPLQHGRRLRVVGGRRVRHPGPRPPPRRLGGLGRRVVQAELDVSALRTRRCSTRGFRRVPAGGGRSSVTSANAGVLPGGRHRASPDEIHADAAPRGLRTHSVCAGLRLVLAKGGSSPEVFWRCSCGAAAVTSAFDFARDRRKGHGTVPSAARNCATPPPGRHPVPDAAQHDVRSRRRNVRQRADMRQWQNRPMSEAVTPRRPVVVAIWLIFAGVVGWWPPSRSPWSASTSS